MQHARSCTVSRPPLSAALWAASLFLCLSLMNWSMVDHAGQEMLVGQARLSAAEHVPGVRAAISATSCTLTWPGGSWCDFSSLAAMPMLGRFSAACGNRPASLRAGRMHASRQCRCRRTRAGPLQASLPC